MNPGTMRTGSCVDPAASIARFKQLMKKGYFIAIQMRSRDSLKALAVPLCLRSK